MKDYYQILTVERIDSTATIKRVFRKLALQLHPDVNNSPEARQKFIDLNEAYQVLRNPVQRKRYNRLLDQHKESINKTKNTPRRQRQNEASIKKAAKRGKVRGQKYATETDKNFEKRTDSWASYFIMDVIVELTFRAIGLLISSILGD